MLGRERRDAGMGILGKETWGKECVGWNVGKGMGIQYGDGYFGRGILRTGCREGNSGREMWRRISEGNIEKGV